MSVRDSVTAGSHEQPVYCSNTQGTITLSELMQSGSLDPAGAYSDGTSTGVRNQYDFFDKEEQKRREEYRNRVEKH